MTAIRRLHDFTHSFRFRLFVIFTIGTALISAALATTYVIREEREYRLQAHAQARLLASALAASVRLPLFGNDQLEITRQLRDMADQPDVACVRVVSLAGTTLAEMRRRPAQGTAIVVQRDVETRAESEADALALAGGQHLPVLLGRVQVELDTTRLQQTVRQMTLTTSLYAVIFWLVVVMVSYLTLGRLTSSYQRLLDGLAEMRGGNLEVSIPVIGNDEPARAARAVNEMAAALKQREAENRELQEQLLENMRFKLEETQKQNMAKLIQTNRMTSLGLLVSSMAHEINNPNGTIRLEGNFLGKMLEEMADQLGEYSPAELRVAGLPLAELRQELRRAHQNLQENTGRIETVIKDLRTYSLGGNTPHQPNVDVNRMATAALTVIRSLGRYTNARIEEEFADDLPEVSGSHHQLEQVVVNLLLNALQSLPPHGGTVRVTTGYSDDRSEVLVSVSDTGEGIPQENLDRLYEPFFSTRIESGGSGLGLYISRFIVGEHKGALEFSSRAGSGTTVRMRLPVPTTA